ncbi:3948_t:CDS:2, partial [Scutellospora calospora]
LYDIHEVGLEHKDFHCGNIVIDNNVSYITDFGLCNNISYGNKDGYPPYFNIPHDDKLAFDIICNNLRPKVDKNTTPQIIIKLIESCLSENFEERPTAIDLLDKISSCMQKDSEIWYQIKTIEENKNFNIAQSEACLDYKILKEASYTSKDINFISESDVASYMSRHISFQLETVDAK